MKIPANGSGPLREILAFAARLSYSMAAKVSIEEVTRFYILNGIFPIENIVECGALNFHVGAFSVLVSVKKKEAVGILGDLRNGEIHSLTRSKKPGPKTELQI